MGSGRERRCERTVTWDPRFHSHFRMTLDLGEKSSKGGSEVPSGICRRKIVLHRGLESLGLRRNGPFEGPKVQMFPKEPGLGDQLARFRS